MEILSVYDSAFKPYGRVVEGYPTEGLVKALATTPCTDGVVYLPRVEVLHSAPNAAKIGEGLYGGMPYELGYCNGHNTKLNCLEFHRDSEFNLGTDDFILLLATLSDLEDGELDTAKVKAFKVPAGVMVEVYATTLHYAPCHADAKKGFRVMVALPGDAGVIADAPGLRSLPLVGHERGLARAFPEIVEASRACRFGDCTHTHEPGCAVREAEDAGQIDSLRLETFQNLASSMRVSAQILDPDVHL